MISHEAGTRRFHWSVKKSKRDKNKTVEKKSVNREKMPCSRHPHGVPVSGQSQPRRNVTGIVLRRPQAVGRNLERRKPHPLRIRRAMTVPIKSWVIHQNGESAADKEHQKKEVHKMGQSQPCGEAMRSRRIFQIDWWQESFRWKSGDQILSPRNRHWSESETAKAKRTEDLSRHEA